MNIFVNPDDGRPRAGWRLALQLVLFFLLLFVMILVKNAVLASSLKIYDAFFMGTAGIASVWIAAIILDKRKITDYGITFDPVWTRELVAGLALGAIAMTVIFLLEWVAGWITITGFGWERAASLPYSLWIISYFAAMIIIGFYEELIFRGYQIFNMVEGLQSSRINLKTASLIAILISSIIFGLLHAGNPNASLLSTLNIIFAGAILAIPYLVTGRLAISIGIHISWNFLQGGLYGFAVSGTIFRGSIIQIDQSGINYITGGNFGPEAGLIGIFGILLILCFFMLYIRRRHATISIHTSFKNKVSKSAKWDE